MSFLFLLTVLLPRPKDAIPQGHFSYNRSQLEIVIYLLYRKRYLFYLSFLSLILKMLAEWYLDLKTWAHLSLCVCVCVCVCARAHALSHSILSNSSQLWTVVYQAPLSTGSSRQEYWSRLSFPPPKYLPNPGIEPMSPVSPALQVDSLLLNHQGSIYHCTHFLKKVSSFIILFVYWEEYCWWMDSNVHT